MICALDVFESLSFRLRSSIVFLPVIMPYAIVVHNFHARILSRLDSLSAPLLSNVSSATDILATSSVGDDSTGHHIYYMSSNNPLRLFQCIIVGEVKEIICQDSVAVGLNLGVPSPASALMDEAFSKQMHCLRSIIVRECDGRESGSSPQALLSWTPDAFPPAADSSQFISICIGPTTQVSRATPHRTFNHVRKASDDSSISSSTLSSTDNAVQPPVPSPFLVGDLVAVKCTFDRYDFPRPNSLDGLWLIRIYSVLASDVDIII
ncbi:hypothetical protein C8R43DRAFT_1132353 [Mycena crocata]|nr:hypothetical protein C8R43DRAFT_1132353 [Mycena crocata]